MPSIWPSPKRVLDIGANTGEFSALAAAAGAEVVALERDPAAADRLFAMASERNLSIQTIQADLARPTPAAGWENAESLALLPRLERRFDLVLMLAVIHHLILMEQIPIPAILSLCHRLTTRYLVIEWVPVDGPHVPEVSCADATASTAPSARPICSAPAMASSSPSAASPSKTAASCSSSRGLLRSLHNNYLKRIAAKMNRSNRGENSAGC